jgi:hypothetical protein
LPRGPRHHQAVKALSSPGKCGDGTLVNVAALQVPTARGRLHRLDLASTPQGLWPGEEDGTERSAVNSPAAAGTWLVWGIGIPADLFDGYMCTNIGTDDEELIAAIREHDPEWRPPNDDVENLDELNDSWATEVFGITEREVQEQVSMYPDEVRGVTRLS